MKQGLIAIPQWPSGEERPGDPAPVFNQYVIRSRDRDALRDYRATRGIGTEIYYPLPLHLQPCFKDLGYKEGDFPVTEKAAREVLALPIFPELTRDQQEYLVEGIHHFYQRRTS
jgi:dTDP-4-amino-4,6-dideoxygalactose transaminase